MGVIILYITGPLIVLIYKILEHYNIWNKISGRYDAIKGLNRLKDTSGFPVSFIYNDEVDKKEFGALFKRIKKNTENAIVKNILNEGHVPSLISTAGKAIFIDGLPPEWKQNEKHYYSPNQPILLCFGVERNGEGKGKADRCCTIGDLENWINKEKKNWDFWLGVVVLSIFTIASIILRLQFTK